MLKGGCTGSSESTLVKMSHCWKSHVTAHIVLAGELKIMSSAENTSQSHTVHFRAKTILKLTEKRMETIIQNSRGGGPFMTALRVHKQRKILN